MKRAALLTLLLAACGIPANNPSMEPGQDCMSCHSATAGVGAPAWTVAGTLYAGPASAADAGVEGGKIYIVDGKGRSFTLTTNSSGNFYTAEQLSFPLAKVQAEINGTRMAMVGQPPTGSCNACHSQPASSEAPGRLFVPSSGTTGH